MTKKELHKIEVAKRMEIRRIAKEKRDAEKAEKSRLWKLKLELSAKRKLEEAEVIRLNALRKELIVQRKYESVFDDNLYLLGTKIPKNILKGDGNDVIKESLFFEIRNASFALTAAKKYSVSLPEQGPVTEHVNGRTNLGIYCAWLVLNKEINNWEDLYKFLLKFGCWIKTTKDFNNHIEKFQNHDHGAIKSEVYIREYENTFNYKFSDEEKTQFSDRFLSTHYGVVTKDMIINYIREKK